MADSIKEQIAVDFEKAKAAGGTRAARIREIVREATAQAMTEFKAGSKEISAIAKERLSTTVQDEPLTVEVEPTTSPTETVAIRPVITWKTLIAALFTKIKNRLLVQVQQKSTHLRDRYVQLKTRTADWDTKLTERYGHRYTAGKQRLDDLASWYRGKVALQTEIPGVTVVQQQQADLETQAGNTGASVARQELLLRHKLKTLLQNAANKL